MKRRGHVPAQSQRMLELRGMEWRVTKPLTVYAGEWFSLEKAEPLARDGVLRATLP